MTDKVFYISDTHFSSSRTFELSRRDQRFSTTDEMDRYMISKWNERVGKDDIVVHGGDFGNYSVAENLNGNIILLYGNYERDKADGDPVEYKDLFTELVDEEYLYLASHDLVIVHEPSNIIKCRRDLKLLDSQFYLFGHIHEKQKIKECGLNIGVDVNNFSPVSIDDINFYREAYYKGYFDKECLDNF